MFRRFETLPHIEIEREPIQREIRPRLARGRSVPVRENRAERGEALKAQTTAAAQQLTSVRTSLGIDPRRLLVLRLETLDADQREAIERLDITVVEELRERRGGNIVFRVLAQFPDEQTLQAFIDEHDSYGREQLSPTALPFAQRRNFFDALESVSVVTPEERTGGRLRREGVPTTEPFYLDVDLWNPGTPQAQAEVIRAFRQLVESRGGTVVGDPLRIPSLILAKVGCGTALLQELFQLDLVSLIDLPPKPPPEEAFDIFREITVPEVLPPIPPDGPLACVVDSGVVAGHPLLRGTVLEEADFGSGEDSTVDRNGHGSQVAGLVVYGDIAKRTVSGEWIPQVSLCVAKVLRHREDPTGQTEGLAEFPEEQRAERQLTEAIEYFARARNVRVFNLSIGNLDRMYAGGRQLPWAEALDDLARRLDIVIVVPTGNVPDPEIPVATSSQQLQRAVLAGLTGQDHRLIDPATAALCLTVGSLARAGEPYGNQTELPGSPPDCPSPFTRTGPGVADGVKPELAHYGGNFTVTGIGSTVFWRKQNPGLSEPTLNHAFATGRLLKGAVGTSFAAAHVTHIAARAEAALREQLGRPPTANLIRALVVDSARVPPGIYEWTDGRRDPLLRSVGYGTPAVDACWSTFNRVSLIAEDTVPYRTFHVYALQLPEVFLDTQGRKSVTVTLAYDPPTRLSRRDYLATVMWLEIFRGLTTEQIVEYRSKYAGDGEPPRAPDRNKLDFQPPGQVLRPSTVQSRRWESNRGSKLNYRPDEEAEPTFHIFVGCQPRFPDPFGQEQQRYALIVTLEHEDQAIELYQEVQARVRTRVRVRAPS